MIKKIEKTRDANPDAYHIRSIREDGISIVKRADEMRWIVPLRLRLGKNISDPYGIARIIERSGCGLPQKVTCNLALERRISGEPVGAPSYARIRLRTRRPEDPDTLRAESNFGH